MYLNNKNRIINEYIFLGCIHYINPKKYVEIQIDQNLTLKDGTCIYCLNRTGIVVKNITADGKILIYWGFFTNFCRQIFLLFKKP